MSILVLSNDILSRDGNATNFRAAFAFGFSLRNSFDIFFNYKNHICIEFILEDFNFLPNGLKISGVSAKNR